MFKCPVPASSTDCIWTLQNSKDPGNAKSYKTQVPVVYSVYIRFNLVDQTVHSPTMSTDLKVTYVSVLSHNTHHLGTSDMHQSDDKPVFGAMRLNPCKPRNWSSYIRHVASIRSCSTQLHDSHLHDNLKSGSNGGDLILTCHFLSRDKSRGRVSTPTSRDQSSKHLRKTTDTPTIWLIPTTVPKIKA